MAILPQLDTAYKVFGLLAAIVTIGGVLATSLGLPLPWIHASNNATTNPVLGNTTTLVGDEVFYQNTTLGVSFSYPQTWTADPNPTSNGTYPETYYLLYPPNGDNMSDILFRSYNVESYEANNSSEPLLNFVNTMNQQNMLLNGNFTIVKNVTDTTLGGMPALEVTSIFNWRKNPQVPEENRFICAVKSDCIYCIAINASPSYYDSVNSYAQQIVNSFTFT
jgi:hypothetical protein